MENILKQLKENVESYEQMNGKAPDYVIMGWDLAYEIRRMKDVYKCTLSREYVYDIPVLETNITGVLALGTRCQQSKGNDSAMPSQICAVNRILGSGQMV